MEPRRARSSTPGTTSGETTVRRAPSARRPSTLRSATSPPPTTSAGRPRKLSITGYNASPRLAGRSGLQLLANGRRDLVEDGEDEPADGVDAERDERLAPGGPVLVHVPERGGHEPRD